MTMIPTNGFPFTPRPYTNITPFTVRDNATYLNILESMREWLINSFVPHVDGEIGALSESWTNTIDLLTAQIVTAIGDVETDKTEIAAALAAAIAARDATEAFASDAAGIQDTAITGIFNNAVSTFRVALNNVYARKNLETLVDTGRLSQTALDSAYVNTLDFDTFTSNLTTELEALGMETGTNATAITSLGTSKRDVASFIPLASVSFDTLTPVGSYLFSNAPTNAGSPVGVPGILTVESSGTLVTQTYRTTANETWERFGSNSVWSMWRIVDNRETVRPRTKIAFIGDSYMVGLGLANVNSRYTTLLASSLGVLEQNLANSGSGYVNAGASGNFVTQSFGVATDADTVIISGGINDAPLVPAQEQISTAIASIVNNIRTNAPKAKIVFISPMWFQNTPSAELALIDDKIRIAVTAQGLRYVEDAMYLRVDRDELTQGDGHPNEAGSIVIRDWALDQLANKPGIGATRGLFVRSAATDATFAGPTVNNLAEGTIKGARRGWWRISGQAVMYKDTLGFLQLRVDGYIDEIRHDIYSGGNPTIIAAELDYYHNGGDLPIAIAYRPNGSSTTTVLGSRKTRITANWVSI